MVSVAQLQEAVSHLSENIAHITLPTLELKMGHIGSHIAQLIVQFRINPRKPLFLKTKFLKVASYVQKSTITHVALNFFTVTTPM